MWAAASIVLVLQALVLASSPDPREEADYLSLLLDPVPGKDRFFEEFWQSKPAVIRRHNATFYNSVMQKADLDSMLYHIETLTPENQLWKLVKRIKGHDGESWSSSPESRTEMTGLPGNATYVDVAHAAFSHGYSLILNRLERYWNGTSEIALSFERELGHHTTVNCYFTPIQSQAFEAHFDWMDAFVLQLEGSKRWRLYNTFIEQPRPDMVFKPTMKDIGESFVDFVLEAGDLLYLPSGVIHEALTEAQEVSLHLTVGVETTLLGSWESLLLEFIVVDTFPFTCSGSVGDASLFFPQCPSAVAVLTKNTTAGLRQGDLVALTIMHVAKQERALRRPVPLTPLMTRTSHTCHLDQLGKMATLVYTKADVQAAWKELLSRNGILARLVVFGNEGTGMAQRLTSASVGRMMLPERVEQGVYDTLACLKRAFGDRNCANMAFFHFEDVCRRKRLTHYAKKTTKK